MVEPKAGGGLLAFDPNGLLAEELAPNGDAAKLPKEDVDAEVVVALTPKLAVVVDPNPPNAGAEVVVVAPELKPPNAGAEVVVAAPELKPPNADAEVAVLVSEVNPPKAEAEVVDDCPKLIIGDDLLFPKPSPTVVPPGAVAEVVALAPKLKPVAGSAAGAFALAGIDSFDFVP